MPQDHQVRVVQCEEQGVLLEVGGVGGRKIKELSDGYQSMLGMAVDIMKVLSRSGAPIESAEGVVMIDELGNHFHPAWRLQCLNAMRTAFPERNLSIAPMILFACEGYTKERWPFSGAISLATFMLSRICQQCPG